MKYLLDTSVFLWSLGADHRLNQNAKTILSAPTSELYLSPASSWEIAIKYALGSLPLAKPPSEFVPSSMTALGVRSLEITHLHSLIAGGLPPHHRDPFDRMLIAQAQAEDMTLLTGDRNLHRYEVELIFCNR
jgi:PIN domain nuclease of toxin-antitoxin system